ncbi:hypothetical protein [Phenylobacterium aquaticum]|uniref:hypothetical protein n=1 Tax=Phenylobacterium aquaticum TaxID=1763816 RepID=UPI0026EDD582|nr:hypothetical protein [Phenylobacterium aquaticum]
MRPAQVGRAPFGLIALFSLSTLAGLIGRGIKGGWWLNDFDAVACAAWRVAHHLPLYAEGLSCPGGRPAAYVYLPQLAWALSPLASGPGISTLRLVYGLAYAGLMAWMFWVLFLRPAPDADLRHRAPILAMCKGSALSCGNIAGPCHAAVLTMGGAGWAMIPVILGVALIKPVYLTYLLIFAYAADPWRLRAAKLAVGLCGAGLAAVWVVVTGGPEIAAWGVALDSVVIGQQTGVGFLDDVAHLGLRGGDLATQTLWLVFAGLMSLSGLAIAEARQLGPQPRFLLALAVAQLCNPRLMDYDLVLMAGGVAVVAGGEPQGRRAVVWVGIVCLTLSLAEQTALAIRLGPALLALLLLAAGVRAMSVRSGALGWPGQARP